MRAALVVIGLVWEVCLLLREVQKRDASFRPVVLGRRFLDAIRQYRRDASNLAELRALAGVAVDRVAPMARSLDQESKSDSLLRA